MRTRVGTDLLPPLLVGQAITAAATDGDSPLPPSAIAHAGGSAGTMRSSSALGRLIVCPDAGALLRTGAAASLHARHR
jgi:hypothetical protein